MDALDPRYTTIFCDLWGVVHDGFHLFPSVLDRLVRWAGEGRQLVLVSNAPRTAEAVQAQLGALGLPRDTYLGISTGGQAGIDALLSLDEPVGFLGTERDRSDLVRAGIQFSDAGFRHLACTGLDEQREQVSDYVEDFEILGKNEVVLHCLNPDRIVVHGGALELCAGALADAYEGLGGQVCWYGKPYPAIYKHALGVAGDPAPATVLAIGDGLLTDVLGAARQGFDCLFVSGGINAGAGYPVDFGELHQLGDWQPIGTVASIG